MMASLLEAAVVLERRMEERTSRVMRGRVPIVMDDIFVFSQVAVVVVGVVVEAGDLDV